MALPKLMTNADLGREVDLIAARMEEAVFACSGTEGTDPNLVDVATRVINMLHQQQIAVLKEAAVRLYMGVGPKEAN